MNLSDTSKKYLEISQKIIEASYLSGIPFEVFLECIGVLLTEHKKGKTMEECEEIANEFFLKEKKQYS